MSSEGSALPRANRQRPFTLLDGMILIATVAVILWVPGTFRALTPPETYRIYDTRQYALMILAAWLATASLALTAAAWLGPGPARRQRYRQPGVLAVSLVTLTLGYELVQFTGHGLTLKLTTGTSFEVGRFWWVFGPAYNAASDAGLAVLAGGMTLKLTGTWRPSPNWLDRTGRVLGLVWVALGLLAGVLEVQTLFWTTNQSLCLPGQ